MYDQKRLIRDFETEEILDGLEIYLNRGVTANHNDTLNYREGNEQNIQIIGNFTEKDMYGWEDLKKVKVFLNHEKGELIKTYCECRDFECNRYSCRHITAMLIFEIFQTQGNVFIGTELEKKLSYRTGVAAPFDEGALRRTDRRLSTIINRAKTFEKISFDNKVKTDILSAEYHLEKGDFGLEIGLKIGSKRKYVVKKLDDFFESYANKKEYQLGKDTVMLGAEYFCEEDRKALNLLLEYAVSIRNVYAGAEYSPRSLSVFGKSITVGGKVMDEFFEVVKELPVYYNKKLVNVFEVDDKPQLIIKKLKYGAEVSLGSMEIIGQSKEYTYFIVQNNISRVKMGIDNAVSDFILEINDGRPHFVSERDMNALCTDLLVNIENIADVETFGFDLTAYEPEIPAFEIYLDMPQDDMISCQAFAVYSYDRFPLYMPVENASRRNLKEEQQAENILRPWFDAFEADTGTMFFQIDEKRLFDFLSTGIEEMRRLGEVFASDALNKLKAKPVSSIQMGVSIDGGLLDIKLASDGFSVKELEEIFSTYNRKKKYHRLKDGSFVTFTDEQVSVMEIISEFYKSYASKGQIDMKVPLFRALYLEESLKDRDSIQLDKSRDYRRLVKNIRTATDGDYEAPASIRKILRPYQREGFRWIKTLKSNGFGGILADDMGLGKTLQVLAYILSEKEEGKAGDELRTLIITPASLVYNWQREIEKFAPQLSVCIVAGQAQARQNLIEDVNVDADVWITSYDLLKRDIKIYENTVFANEFIDEAQFIKNQTTQVAKAVRLVNSSFRLALTGTPIENRLSELWSIFDYLMPGFLFTYSKFRAEYETPITTNGDEEALDRLRRMVTPFILRRLKSNVLKELPEKIEEVVAVRLDSEQKKIYDAYEQRLKLFLDRQSDDEFKNSRIEILAELTKLRQICCSPNLLLENYKGSSAKLETCMELISQAIDGGHKILIFSQFTSMLDEIGKALADREINYYRIDGSTSKEDRMKYVDAFQTDDVPVFCISLKAGGTGLNLTAADIVIHYDPWWNVAAQNQATDRTHRIGQKKIVTVYQLIAEQTIEDRIRRLQQSKYELAKEVLSGENIASVVIDRDEILKLLG